MRGTADYQPERPRGTREWSPLPPPKSRPAGMEVAQRGTLVARERSTVELVFGELVPPLSPVEETYLRRVVERLRGLESRTRGAFAEVLISSLLPGAHLAAAATSPHDLEWSDITIAVRATGTRNADHGPEHPDYLGEWTFRPVQGWVGDDFLSGGETRRCWADVAVLAFHEGWDINSGWWFWVLTRQEIDSHRSMRFTPKRLVSEGFERVDASGLASAIRSAFSRQQGSTPAAK